MNDGSETDPRVDARSDGAPRSAPPPAPVTPNPSQARDSQELQHDAGQHDAGQHDAGQHDANPHDGSPNGGGQPDASQQELVPQDVAQRNVSVMPPGPGSDRYLGCTIDNRYKVEGIVGEGGMGVVYQCRHKIINKRVALKILRADLARDAEVTERFLMEAKAASAIDDEHIIDISDFGQLPDGAAYFVMEFLDGTPLSQLSGAGKSMAPSRIVHIALQLAEGLAAAHRMGIVHRDLKPDNVFLITRGKETDFVKILDFGIAKVSTRATGRLTQVGSVFGTPHYMSPEQAAGAPLDQRGDIYAMGVILYELATGHVPFDADNFVGILSQQLYQAPIPPRERAPELNIAPALEALIMRCLEKKPEDRYQSMHELHSDLLDLQAMNLDALPVPWSQQHEGSAPGYQIPANNEPELSTGALRPPRRWPLYVAIAAPLAIVGSVFALQISSRHDAAARAPEKAAALPPVPEPQPQAVAEPPAPPIAAPEPATTKVILGVAPTSARVFRGQTDLGTSPVVIDVPTGSEVDVEIRHPEYKTRRLVLDGKDSRVAIELEPLKKAKARKKASDARQRKAGPKTPLGGELFVEPWEKR
jgi:serine/threonine protein kinase